MTTELVCVNNSDNMTKIDTFHLPRWSELPSIDLYIDQIISLIEKCLGPLFCNHDGFPLTKSMINNYVKAKLVDAPVNKKYPRLSVAMIFVVCILKNCYTTEEIGRLIQLGISLDDPETTYDRFCESIENALRDVFSGEIIIHDENLAKRPDKYLMDNFALSFACKFYVQKTFLNSGKL